VQETITYDYGLIWNQWKDLFVKNDIERPLKLVF
jgi:hypothetical protein